MSVGKKFIIICIYIYISAGHHAVNVKIKKKNSYKYSIKKCHMNLYESVLGNLPTTVPRVVVPLVGGYVRTDEESDTDEEEEDGYRKIGVV